MNINVPGVAAESRRILFLDIDGVVLPLSQSAHRRYEDYAPDQIPLPLQRLVALLDEHAEIELVLSSSWRIDVGIEHARELLPNRHRQRLIGVTPLIGNGGDRGEECLRWITNQDVQSDQVGFVFAALDDCRQLFSSNFKGLVLVNARVGIEDDSIFALKQLLHLPGSDAHHEGFAAESSRQSRLVAEADAANAELMDFMEGAAADIEGWMLSCTEN